MGIEYCVEHNLVPLIIETDSLMAHKILCGSWEAPWLISLNVGYITRLMMDTEVEVQTGNNYTTSVKHLNRYKQ
ncbi:hypothetical protein H5410_046749 [Solanum commersonii]|uniref:RNase H type-1 domain-containing protein n=1 Tax=Solanum commersonii TaxID=4109 RepID=A0A9J5XD49_SOLCO|nr:hypothetical protein H5410_046749 [Solanum commersonii]